MGKTKENSRKKDMDSIKAEYNKLSRIYSLPAFDKIREDFDIDKVLEKDEKFLLRDIRRTIAEKLAGYLHLFESLVNPAGSPMFIFAFIKNLSAKEKLEIKDLYRELSKMQIISMKLDTIYSEKTEAESVSLYFFTWQKMKKRIYALVEVFEREFEKDSEEKSKSYFG